MPAKPTDDPSGEFLGHMLKSQRALRNYLFSLHPRERDIDDLLQETARTLWKEFGKFDRSREFLPWALRIGYFEVLRFRKKQTRDRLVFSEDLLELLADEEPPDVSENAARRALDACLAKLDAHSREVLMARYDQQQTVAELASERNTSVHRLYRLLDRARASVVTCIRRHLHLEGELPAP
jgi:RNA polymerase sigma-70 factor (ECF subfamily)